MKDVTVKDLMVKKPVLVSEEETLQEAAAKMHEVGCGVLPVGTKNNIVGMITDRDIVIRAIAEGKDPAVETVGDHMTAKAVFCKETDTIRQAAAIMKKNKISRLLVQNGGGNITGILSFGCILRKSDNAEDVADVITGVKRRKAA